MDNETSVGNSVAKETSGIILGNGNATAQWPKSEFGVAKSNAAAGRRHAIMDACMNLT